MKTNFRFQPNDFVRIDTTVEKYLSITTQTIVKSNQAIFVCKESLQLIFNSTNPTLDNKVRLYLLATVSKWSIEFEPIDADDCIQLDVSVFSNNDTFYVDDSGKRIVKILTLVTDIEL